MLFFLSLVLLAAPHRVTDDTGCNKGLDANNELDGEIICTFGDGTKKYEGVYAHGKRVGLAKSWRQNGVLASVDRFVDGKRDGLCEEYGPDGLLTESCVYKADLKDGRCKLYGREGKLREERLYVAGQQRGAFTAYWPNGKVVERGALDESGRPHGVKERFREDGTPDSLETYVHGEKDGVEREWHPNGKLRRETWWKKNVQHGLTTTARRKAKRPCASGTTGKCVTAPRASGARRARSSRSRTGRPGDATARRRHSSRRTALPGSPRNGAAARGAHASSGAKTAPW